MEQVTVNGRGYRPPREPVVAVCIDGSAPDYFSDGLARGKLPALARFRARGFYGLARAAVPTFTNPNNLSIVTGAAPAVHGISGNFFLEPESGQEIMMNEPRFLRAESLLAAFSRQGAQVAIVTAKDKLRRLLGHGVRGGVCFSSEKAHEASLAEHGIEGVNALVGWPTPDVYSAELSTFVLEAGLKLLERRRPQLMYLSLTDYIQHTHAPGTPEADRFYAALDGYFDAFDRAGAVVALTADHGMNAKADGAGRPNIVYLASLLEGWLGPGQARVILPITDPYVAHHGSLGSYATVYLAQGVEREPVRARLAGHAGIEYVAEREAACARFALPPDRVGDLVVISDRRTVLGKSPEAHDLTQLHGVLRSHGGLAEQEVPFVLNRPLTRDYARKAAEGLRNFDLFDFALNGV
ncbi:MAG: phosphonoacetate hydrolase [Candidatus Lambdaproteobacteria bacterium]|nr:phosphonoacetate hydrolase [Candidatus Lambdaproteobacteria bacterium]